MSPSSIAIIYIYIYKSLYVISAIYNVTISHYKSRYAHIYMSLYVISSIYYYKYVPIIYMSYIYHHIIVSPIYHHITITNTSSSFFLIAIYHHVIIQVMYHYITHISPIYHPYITHISPIYHPYITHISPIYHPYITIVSLGPEVLLQVEQRQRWTALDTSDVSPRAAAAAAGGPHPVPLWVGDDVPGETMGFPCSYCHGC